MKVRRGGWPEGTARIEVQGNHAAIAAIARTWMGSVSMTIRRPWLLASVALSLCWSGLLALAAAPEVIERDGVTKIRLLPPGPGNPRNSEGAFLALKDG
jgi:hypothetical protein